MHTSHRISVLLLHSNVLISLSDNDQMRQRGAIIDPHARVESPEDQLHPGVKKKIKKRRQSAWSTPPLVWMLTMTAGGALLVLLSRYRKDPILFKPAKTGTDSLEASATVDRRLKMDRTNRRHHKKDKYAGRNDEASIEGPLDKSHQNSDISSQFPFVLPQLNPGDMSPFLWRSDGTKVDKHARLVGLPPGLTDEIRKFCEETGLMVHFRSLMYSDPVKQGNSRLLELKGNRQWAATRPTKTANWVDSNLHWVDPADEASFEEALSVLKRGGIGKVIDAVGSEFQSDGLSFLGLGFIVVSHSTASQMHQDNPGGGKDFFDLLFPLVLPENDVAQLHIGKSKKRSGLVNFEANVGVLLGMDTWHATADCDYRDDNYLRVAVSVYLADVNEDNVELLSEDGTALFPIPGQTNWILAQQGRLWKHGVGLVEDQGRKPFHVEDEYDECPERADEGKCETDLTGVRMECLKSCNIFIDDKLYFSEVVRAAERDSRP